MDKRNEFVDIARQWIGVPYRHQGRTRQGVDCIGLAIACAQALGLPVYDVDGYSRAPSGGMMRRLLKAHTDPMALSDIEPGDLLHMAFNEQPQHLAIVSNLQPLRIIHADGLVGRVVEHGLDGQWRGRIRDAYRIRG